MLLLVSLAILSDFALLVFCPGHWECGKEGVISGKIPPTSNRWQRAFAKWYHYIWWSRGTDGTRKDYCSAQERCKSKHGLQYWRRRRKQARLHYTAKGKLYFLSSDYEACARTNYLLVLIFFTLRLFKPHQWKKGRCFSWLVMVIGLSGVQFGLTVPEDLRKDKKLLNSENSPFYDFI